MTLAPIILFVYNRPIHTAACLRALSANELSDQSVLYIYADGSKAGATAAEQALVQQTRELIRSELWCKEVKVIENDENLGLAANIIQGVTKVVQAHGKVIVLEDDIVTSRGFLRYMNDALDLYERETEVGCIHAWNYHFENISDEPSTFFLKGADCWGWATWRRGWDLFEADGQKLMDQLKASNLTYSFDRNGLYPYTDMLQQQIDGKVNSWAIRWHASLFLLNKFCLQPLKPIVKNIGFDHSGVHCVAENIDQFPVDEIQLEKIPVVEAEWYFGAYKDYLAKSEKKIIRKRENIVSKLKRILTR